MLLVFTCTISCEKNEEIVEEELIVETDKSSKILNQKTKTKTKINYYTSSYVVLLYPQGLTSAEKRSRRNTVASILGVTIGSIEACNSNVDAETVEFRNLIVIPRTDGAGINDPVEGKPGLVVVYDDQLDDFARASGLLAASSVQNCETIRDLMYLGDIRD